MIFRKTNYAGFASVVVHLYNSLHTAKNFLNKNPEYTEYHVQRKTVVTIQETQYL